MAFFGHQQPLDKWKVYYEKTTNNMAGLFGLLLACLCLIHFISENWLVHEQTLVVAPSLILPLSLKKDEWGGNCFWLPIVGQNFPIDEIIWCKVMRVIESMSLLGAAWLRLEKIASYKHVQLVMRNFCESFWKQATIFDNVSIFTCLCILIFSGSAFATSYEA